jgi:hypothetical protein
MKYLELFPRESKNSRRGSDVLKGGESNGVARFKILRLISETPSRILRERRGERRQRLEIRTPESVLIRGYIYLSEVYR